MNSYEVEAVNKLITARLDEALGKLIENLGREFRAAARRSLREGEETDLRWIVVDALETTRKNLGGQNG